MSTKPSSSSSSQPVIPEEFRDIVSSAEGAPYREKKAIGKGSFGTVWQIIQNSTGNIVVGKFMDTTKMTEKNRNFALTEGTNAAKCDHPNITQFIDKYERNGKVLLVFEYADAGDLFAQINARAPDRYFRESEILLIMAQLCLAVNHMHERRMMHRDLKTPNVFLTTCGLIKLGDFGFSREYADHLSADVGSTFCGTPYYLAPELWNQGPYSKKADIWSLGVILYELMSLRKPFTGNGMRELIDRVVAGKFHALPNHYSPALIQLCTAMLSVDPRQRPSVQVIFQNEAMRNGGLMTLRKNVPRLSGVPKEIRDTMVADIDKIVSAQPEALHEQLRLQQQQFQPPTAATPYPQGPRPSSSYVAQAPQQPFQQQHQQQHRQQPFHNAVPAAHLQQPTQGPYSSNMSPNCANPYAAQHNNATAPQAVPCPPQQQGQGGGAKAAVTSGDDNENDNATTLPSDSF